MSARPQHHDPSRPEPAAPQPPRAAEGPAQGRKLSERLTTSERLLDLPNVLDHLVHDGYISQRQAEDVLIAPRTKKELSQHPLEIIADREFGAAEAR